MYKPLLSALTVFISCGVLNAQTPDTTATEDYSQYGDADAGGGKATQKVLNQSPQKLISLGYEHQGPFYGEAHAVPGAAASRWKINRLSGFKAELNVPAISNTHLIWNIGARYWGSRFSDLPAQQQHPLAQLFAGRTLHLAGINTTVFKPLDARRVLVFQASADAGWMSNGEDFSGRSIVYSGSALYGWKTSERNLLALGVSRTYRAGRLIYVPALLWNRTFNDHWGIEMLLPARAHLRYNISTKNMLQLGVELDGSQYLLSQAQKAYLQRGEVKPRIMWDKQLSGFFWLQAQAGFRTNYRFDVVRGYDGKEPLPQFGQPTMTLAPYVQVGIALVTQ